MDYLPDSEERRELLERLSDVIARAGHEHFLAAPILMPSPEFFPDRWTPDVAGVHRLTKRLLRYARLDDLNLHVVTYDARDAEDAHHDGIAGWFAGIVDGQCRFGVDEQHIPDDDAVVGVMCHEVAHAFRAHRSLVGPDRQCEEEDTDITCVYLGFGVLSANNAYRYRSSGHMNGIVAISKVTESQLGYLSPQAFCFLLAAQVVARDEDKAARRAVARSLETNQAACFRAALRLFDAERDELRRALGLPREVEQRRVPLEELTAPLSDDAPPAIPKRKRKRNEARPVFRVIRTRAVMVATSASLIGLVAGKLADGNEGVIFGALFGAILGWLLGARLRNDFCSEPNCEAVLAPIATECPRCGGAIVGTIRKQEDRLEALERLDAEKKRRS